MARPPLQDGRAKTFWVKSPKDVMDKLDWEIERLKEQTVVGTRAIAFAAMDVAVTAYHVLDWIVADLCESNRWEPVAEALALSLDAADFRQRVKQMSEYARNDSPWMTICSEIANAAKHRNLEFNATEAIAISSKHKAKIIFADTGKTGEYERHLHHIRVPVDDEIHEFSTYEFAHEVRTWLAFLLVKIEAC